MENKQPVKKLIARIAAGVGHFFEIRFSDNQTVGAKEKNFIHKRRKL